MLSKADIKTVLQWYTQNQRALPWRTVRDPWLILVSEYMTQQTQAHRAAEKWERFCKLFPTVFDCAAAPQSSIVAEWNGLGFNRRAKYLHQTARIICEKYDGIVPKNLDALLALPGIGSYTARAIRVFAFEEDDAVLDTNTGRIVARLYGKPFTSTEAQQQLESFVPPDQPWEWNQALLDIGASCCRPKNPQCQICPFTDVCLWNNSSKEQADPAKKSAAVSTPQSRFEGSNRQGRGKLLKYLSTNTSAKKSDLAQIMAWPDDPQRTMRVTQELLDEELITYLDNGTYKLF